MNLVGEHELSTYHEAGYVILRGIVKPDLIRTLYEATVRLLHKHSAVQITWSDEAAPWSDRAFHEAMMDLRQRAPEWFGALYDSAQTSVALQRVGCDGFLTRAAATLLGEDPSGLSTTGYMLRMDAPGDNRNRLEWHQESSYYRQNACSDHAIVAWMPMQNLSIDHGPIEVCPGSHRAGRIEVASSGKKDYRTSQQYEVPDDLVARHDVVPVLAQAGDAVLFHMDLFHRSGRNTSGEFRFTAATRYHRMLTEDFVPGRLQYLENRMIADRVGATVTAG